MDWKFFRSILLPKKLPRVKNKREILIYFLFLGFGFFALFNLAVGYNSRYPGSFKVIENILAQVQIPAPNTSDITGILSGYKKVEDGQRVVKDSYDRCLIVDPNLSETRQVQDIASKLGGGFGENLAGVNFTPNIDFVDFRTTPEYIGMLEAADQFGASFVLAQTTKIDSAPLIAQYVNEANEKGLLPIVRLCSIGYCDFDLSTNPDVVANYFKEVNRLSNGEFVAMIGPNEPGTGDIDSVTNIETTEMEGFGFDTGDYSALAAALNDTAESLQPLRAANGGNMYLAPGAFNITNTALGRDDALELHLAGLDYSLYDTLLINTYDMLFDDRSPYEYYEKTAGGFSLKEQVDLLGLKVIVTEFGTMEETSVDTNIDILRDSFNLFCADENVEGVLFFRSFASYVDSYGTERPSQIEDNDIESMVSNCSKNSLRDYAWANCNFDSCVYDDVYNESSVAKACGVTPVDSGSKSVALGLDCSSGLCTVASRSTVQVLMPIKQFGSNSWVGTPNFNYPPACAELATLTFNDAYDPSNQFAGLLMANPTNAEGQFTAHEVEAAMKYPMPWLGSAINCTRELIKNSSSFVDDVPRAIITYPSEGSFISESKSEARYELNQQFLQNLGVTVEGQMSYPLSNSEYIIDERALCLGDDCIEKSKNFSLDAFYGEYTPSELAQGYEHPEVCESTNLIIRNEPNNFIYGPEVWLGDVKGGAVTTGASVCLNYAVRNFDDARSSDRNIIFDNSGEVSCGISHNFGDPAGGCTLMTASQYTAAANCFVDLPEDQLTTTDANGNLVKVQNYKNGNCNLFPQSFDLSAWNTCLFATNSKGAFYESKGQFDSSLPEFEIPGIYDSLYYMYLKTQDTLSIGNKKIVFRENLGWNLIVENKVRDLNRGYNADEPYLYSINHNQDSCISNVEFAGSSFKLARSNPINKQEQYFDWLGYLDVMQEWIMVYSRDQLNSTEEIIVNPLLDPNIRNSTELEGVELSSLKGIGVPENSFPGMASSINNGYIMLSGNASQNTRFPIWTCDEVEFRKIGILFDGDNNPYFGEENEKYPEDFNPTCIDFYNSDTYEDNLKEFLCNKNPFQFPTLCQVIPENYCPLDTTEPIADNPGISENGLIYPVPPDYTTLTSVYGEQEDGSEEDGGYVRPNPHAGVDFPVPFQSEIYAVADGYVQYAGPDKYNPQNYSNCEVYSTCGAYGIVVKIVHPEDGSVSTVYAHLSSLNVSPTVNILGENVNVPQQFVKQGDVIGYSGATGNVTNPHFHFELRRDPDCRWDGNIPVSQRVCTMDPMPFFVGTVADDDGENSGLICTNLEDENNSGRVCNEFNCARGAGWTDNFEGSLECATNTLKFSIYGTNRPMMTLAETLDNYGPYCDTVTNGNNGGISIMPYLNNLFEFYDNYATVKRVDTTLIKCSQDCRDSSCIDSCIKNNNVAGVNTSESNICNTCLSTCVNGGGDAYECISTGCISECRAFFKNSCSNFIPNASRAEDLGMKCMVLPNRKEGDYRETWDYYVGPIEDCGLTFEQMTWNGSVGGRSESEIVDYLYDDVVYKGFTLSSLNVPKAKLAKVVSESRKKGINPFLVIGNWATETLFGTSWDPNNECNFYEE